MKLFEIIDNSNHLDLILQYITKGRRSPELDQAFIQAMKNPGVVYQGAMYRAVHVDPRIVLKAADTRLMMTKVNKYITHNADPFQSWAKSMGGVETAIGTNTTETDYYGEHFPQPNTFVVVQQSGRGVDIDKIIKKFGSQYPDIKGFSGEEEVMAPIQSSVHISGFLHSNGSFFPADELVEFIKSARKEEKRLTAYGKEVGLI